MIMHCGTSCAQVVSVKLGDDDCLFFLLWALAWQTVQGQMSDRKAFFLLCATLDNPYRPSDSGLAFSSRGALTFFTEEKLDMHVHINQGHTVEDISEKVMNILSFFLCHSPGGRLTEVPPCDWRLLSRDILRRNANMDG